MQVLCSLFCLLFTVSSHGDFYNAPPQGFNWYNEEASLVNKDESQMVDGKNRDAKGRNEALKKQLEDAIDQLLDKPTVENAIIAQRMQKLVMDRGEEVSRAWVMAALVDSGLIKMEENPNVLHREIAKAENAGKEAKILQAYAKEWGLVLWWRHNCPYCTKFVPIIQSLQQAYDFQVMAVSETGEDYGPFKGQGDMQGIFRKLNPEGLAPILYLVHRNGDKIIPIAKGLKDADTIKENILLYKRMEEGQHA